MSHPTGPLTYSGGSLPQSPLNKEAEGLLDDLPPGVKVETPEEGELVKKMGRNKRGGLSPADGDLAGEMLKRSLSPSSGTLSTAGPPSARRPTAKPDDLNLGELPQYPESEVSSSLSQTQAPQKRSFVKKIVDAVKGVLSGKKRDLPGGGPFPGSPPAVSSRNDFFVGCQPSLGGSFRRRESMDSQLSGSMFEREGGSYVSSARTPEERSSYLVRTSGAADDRAFSLSTGSRDGKGSGSCPSSGGNSDWDSDLVPRRSSFPEAPEDV